MNLEIAKEILMGAGINTNNLSASYVEDCCLTHLFEKLIGEKISIKLFTEKEDRFISIKRSGVLEKLMYGRGISFNDPLKLTFFLENGEKVEVPVKIEYILARTLTKPYSFVMYPEKSDTEGNERLQYLFVSALA